MSAGVRVAAGVMASAVVAASCVTDPPVPGDETMGHFAFTAQPLPVDGGCTFKELDGGFTFEGTFSRFQNGSGAWFTLNEVSREGSWNGQVFEAPFSAARRFEVDACGNQFTAHELLKVALLSESQHAALGSDCPEEVAPLLEPGGVPVDRDAGVLPPDTREDGFDAARACGLLVERIAPAQACDFSACEMVYRVEGVRTR